MNCIFHQYVISRYKWLSCPAKVIFTLDLNHLYSYSKVMENERENPSFPIRELTWYLDGSSKLTTVYFPSQSLSHHY